MWYGSRYYLLIAGLQVKFNRTLFELNDGTGTIQCIKWSENIDVALGDIITIRGRLELYERLQVNVSFIEQGTIETELFHSMQVIRLQKMYKKNIPIDISKKISKVTSSLNSIKTILAKYLAKLDRETKFKEIISDIDLIAELKLYTTSNIEIVVGKQLQSLVRDGFIYQKDVEQDTYELINISNLGQELVEIVKNEGFVSNDEIVLCLRKSRFFKLACRDKVAHLLDELVSDKKIERLANGKYIY